MALLYTFICAVFLIYCQSVQNTRADPQQKALLMRLFEESDYNRVEVPTVSLQEPLQVNISFYIEKLLEVNSKDESIAVLGFVGTFWYDYRLQWNKTDYGGLDTIVVPPGHVWLPRFTMTNTAAGDLYNELWYEQYFVRIRNDGLMSWFPGGMFKADCGIDVSYFPYDQQICHFDFENWVYSVDKVNLSYTDDAGLNFLKFFLNDNGLWDVQDSKAIRVDKDYGFTNPFPIIMFYLKMQRKHLYYGTNIIFLTIIIAILVLVSFKLPAESGEKVSFSVTLLLSFAVYLVVIIDFLPETSSSIPLISAYLMCFCILTGIAVLQSVFVLYCFHHHGENRAPRCISWFFLVILPKVFCNRRVQNTVYQYHGDSEANVPNEPSSSQEQQFEMQSKGTLRQTKSETEKAIIIQEWQDIARLLDSLTLSLFATSFILIIIVALISIPYGGHEINLEEQIQQDIASIN